MTTYREVPGVDENGNETTFKVEITEREKPMNAQIKYTILVNNECKIGFITANKVEFESVSFPASQIALLLNCINVRSYEELKRKFCRITVEKGRVTEIGDIIEDRWFYLC